MSAELIKVLGSLSIAASVLFVVTYYIFSFGLRVGTEYFKAFDLSYSKFMGAFAIFLFVMGSLFQVVIRMNTIVCRDILIYILLITYFIFYCLLQKRRDKYLMCNIEYVPDKNMFKVLSFSAIFILFISGYIMAGTIFEFRNFSDYTSVLIFINFAIGYLISLISSGYILSYAITFNFKKYDFYSNKLNEYDFFGKLNVKQVANETNLKYRKITGYLIEENKDNLTIKTCRPDDLKVISIKKSLIDIVTIENIN